MNYIHTVKEYVRRILGRGLIKVDPFNFFALFWMASFHLPQTSTTSDKNSERAHPKRTRDII